MNRRLRRHRNGVWPVVGQEIAITISKENVAGYSNATEYRPVS